MWEKEEMRVSEANCWQQGFTQTLCVTSREIPANNMLCLTAVAYRFQEFLVTAVWSQRKSYSILSLESIPLPPATLSCNIKMGHACNTDTRQNICKLCCLSLNHCVVMSQPVKRKNLNHWGLRYLLQLVRSARVTCSVLTPILCILVKLIFWKTSRIWSSGCQEMMTLPLSMTVWSRREGQTRMKGWKLSTEPRDIFFLIRQINHWNTEFLKGFVFSHIAFITKYGFCAAVVGTVSLLTCTKETTGMGGLKAFMHIGILLFQSVTERCMLGHVPFLMHGFKSSSSLQFLVLGYFLEACLHTSRARFKKSCLWSEIHWTYQMEWFVSPRIHTILLCFLANFNSLGSVQSWWELCDSQFGVSLCPASLEYRRRSLMSAYTIPWRYTLSVTRSTSRFPLD